MFYLFATILSSILWIARTHKEALDNEIRLFKEALQWFENLNSPIPAWYLGGYEVWDVYDKDRNKTGRLHERGKPMASGDYHIIVHVWKRNSNDEWLIDKRTPRYGNDELDNKWETTGGCVVAGEDSLTAALRETKEELGIDLDPRNGSLFSSTARIWDDGHTAFVDAWVFECDIPVEEIAFDAREVCDVVWASSARIKAMIDTGELFDYQSYPYFNELIRFPVE